MTQTELKILFIEDNAEDIELSVLELKRGGFNIDYRCADKEKDLREALHGWHPDVILSDYTMPGFSGPAALAISKDIVPDVPFIFVSATIGEERAIESIHRGATDYILKDNLRKLGTAIQRAVSESQERRHAKSLEQESSRLARILESTSDMVMICNPDESVTYLNQGARHLLGLSQVPNDLKLRELFAARDWDHINSHVRTLAISEGIWQGESELVAQDGTQIPVSLVVICHEDAEGESEYFSFIARDIRDRKAYEKQIRYLANYDSLTDLPNITLLKDRVAQAINYAGRTNSAVAVLTINIDRFKTINDGYGQEQGNLLLRKFGARLNATVSRGDTVARLGGDTFAMLITDLASAEDAISVVRRVQGSLAEPFKIYDRSLTVSASIGASVYPRDGNDCSNLLQNSDIALHRAKEDPGIGFQFYTEEMTQSAADRFSLENELQFALSRDELELYYQPQIDLASGLVIGIEALMRWNHPNRGLISPDLFIDLAEKSDLIQSLGEWALRRACQQVRHWDKAGVQELRLAVNVSARQFCSPGFPAVVEHALRAAGLDSRRLELEVTESVLVHDHEDTRQILEQLTRSGISIALDDFGTGYSNLSYFSRLPIHCLKIDQAFVARALTDSNDAEIVRAIISLAEALDLRVLAEGIESEGQLELLRSLSCHEGQGYLFARPLPGDEIPDMLKSTPEHLHQLIGNTEHYVTINPERD